MAWTREAASWTTTAAIALLLAFFCYHALGAYAALGPRWQEYSDRAKFLEMSGVHEMSFLAGVVVESRHFLAEGLFAPWIVRYVESLWFVRWLSGGGYLLGLVGVVLAIVAMTLLKCHLSERYATDRMVGAMTERTRHLKTVARRQRQLEEERLLAAADPSEPTSRALLVAPRVEEIAG